jgi:hypothetical protein
MCNLISDAIFFYIFFNKNQYEYSEDGECLISVGEGGDGDDENNSERTNVCTKEQSKKSLSSNNQ